MNLKDWKNQSPVRTYLDAATPPKDIRTPGRAIPPWRTFLHDKDRVKERHIDNKYPVDRVALYLRDAHDEWVRSRFVQVDIWDPIERGRIR